MPFHIIATAYSLRTFVSMAGFDNRWTNKTESYWPAYVGMKNTNANLRARANFKKGEKPSYIRA